MTVKRTVVISQWFILHGISECTLEELLLKLGLGNLNLHGLVHLLVVSSLVIGIVFDGRGKESVDEGCLSETGLASNLHT